MLFKLYHLAKLQILIWKNDSIHPRGKLRLEMVRKGCHNFRKRCGEVSISFLHRYNLVPSIIPLHKSIKERWVSVDLFEVARLHPSHTKTIFGFIQSCCILLEGLVCIFHSTILQSHLLKDASCMYLVGTSMFETLRCWLTIISYWSTPFPKTNL